MTSSGEQISIQPAEGEDEIPEPSGEEIGGLSLSYLVERLGQAPGTELFERMDQSLRFGERVIGTTVRAARKSFATARVSRHARVVVAGRPGGARALSEEAKESMVMIALEDLEAVVKAAQADFDWAAEFSPRRDLLTATCPIVIRSGIPGRRMLIP